jgi:hypothetical protein
MTQDKPRGPAQPIGVEQVQTAPGPDRSKDAKKLKDKPSEDMPGADGRLSARADEDTYD